MPTDYDTIEDQIQNAVNTFKHDKSRKKKELARQFNVPYHRLLNRLNGRPSKLHNRNKEHTLNKQQEDAVKQWLDQLDKAGQAPTAERLENCANSILNRQHTDPTSPAPTVGKMWAYRFMNRLPKDYKRQRKKPKEPKRIYSEEVSQIITWFERFEAIVKKH